MPVNPADQAVRRAVSDILSNFLNNYEWDCGPLAALRDQVYKVYRPFYVDAAILRAQLCGDSDVALRNQHRFLFLEPVVDRKILPLLTLETSNDWVNFRAYVLLTMLDQCAALQALAIRFETDEGAPQRGGRLGTHDFCHAQLCRCINGKTRAMTPNWLPESQPSFPLDAGDQIGLVLCMLTSLYGGRHVHDRLIKPRDRNLRKHLKKIRALRANIE